MNPIRIEQGIVVYYGNLAGRVTNGKAIVDPMFQGAELTDFLSRQKNIREVQWTTGVFDRLMGAGLDSGEAQVLKNCRIWQLKPEVDIYKKFIGYEQLLRDFGPPDALDYQVAFDGEVNTNDLEELYDRFRYEPPSDYADHSISISDVLELYDENGREFHYVDRIGFKQVDFAPSAPQMGQNLQL